ncbi:hypothetical protein A7K99_11470 [Tatumella citrea]|uniref:Uncharacterized protein n=1 Tax=Tatumella citrea TaxID=53336 RepID=A0A1Y0L8G9_TATCI|nr:hypothetical protein A7K98_11470 [Tatumella citrea]ARU98374.1 hypothetical protein A7K99_11470 [Tatumella citrea]
MFLTALRGTQQRGQRLQFPVKVGFPGNGICSNRLNGYGSYSGHSVEVNEDSAGHVSFFGLAH